MIILKAKSPNFEHFYRDHLGVERVIDNVFFFDELFKESMDRLIGQEILDGVEADNLHQTLARLEMVLTEASAETRYIKEFRKISHEFEPGSQGLADAYYQEYKNVVRRISKIVDDFKRRLRLRKQYLRGEGLHLNHMVDRTEDFLMEAF